MSDSQVTDSPTVIEGRHGGKLIPWQKGKSGNPGGRNGVWNQVQTACRTRSMQAVETLSNAMRSDDERVAITAAQKVLEWAWGAPQAFKGEDDSRMVLDLKKLSGADLALLGKILTSGAVRSAEEQEGVVVSAAEEAP